MNEIVTPSDGRDRALELLRGLNAQLAQTLPNRTDVANWMRRVKDQRPNSRAVPFEGLFLDEFVLPEISRFLRETVHLNQAEARGVFLAESELMKRVGLASKTPASEEKHLFAKYLGLTPKKVAALWWDNPEKAVSQSCPDWALKAPYGIVFEGKFFRSGSLEVAQAELVSSIYQCFFYRGQKGSAGTKRHAGWDYDYACLFAYDASEQQRLVEAWSSLDKQIKDAFWESANIYVMVFPLKV